MSEITKEWIGVVAFGLAAGAFLAISTQIIVPCKPGDGSFYVGGVILLAGCPDERTPRLIYRNDGSVTPP
jgi:hypothetical protein